MPVTRYKPQVRNGVRLPTRKRPRVLLLSSPRPGVTVARVAPDPPTRREEVPESDPLVSVPSGDWCTTRFGRGGRDDLVVEGNPSPHPSGTLCRYRTDHRILKSLKEVYEFWKSREFFPKDVKSCQTMKTPTPKGFGTPRTQISGLVSPPDRSFWNHPPQEFFTQSP